MGGGVEERAGAETLATRIASSRRIGGLGGRRGWAAVQSGDARGEDARVQLFGGERKIGDDPCRELQAAASDDTTGMGDYDRHNYVALLERWTL